MEDGGDFCDIESGTVVARHIVLGISHTTTREWAQKEKSSSQWHLCWTQTGTEMAMSYKRGLQNSAPFFPVDCIMELVIMEFNCRNESVSPNSGAHPPQQCFHRSRNLESRETRLHPRAPRPAGFPPPAAEASGSLLHRVHRGAAHTYERRFKTRQLTCWSAASICVSLPSFLMDVQRGERKSIIDGVFIWSFMLELKTDEELKRWPGFFCRSPFQQRQKEERNLRRNV